MFLDEYLCSLLGKGDPGTVSAQVVMDRMHFGIRLEVIRHGKTQMFVYDEQSGRFLTVEPPRLEGK